MFISRKKPKIISLIALLCIVSATAFLMLQCNPPERTVSRSNFTLFAEKIEKKGLPNLGRINKNLYRGGQPTKEGFAELKKMGIKTIVNLRSLHSDKDLIEGMGFKYIEIPWVALFNPSEDSVVEFLREATDDNNSPVFIHCKRGADRTGTMCAIYRIVVDGWSRESAISEMDDFGLSAVYENFKTFIKEADTEKLREQMHEKNTVTK